MKRRRTEWELEQRDRRAAHRHWRGQRIVEIAVWAAGFLLLAGVLYALIRWIARQ